MTVFEALALFPPLVEGLGTIGLLACPSSEPDHLARLEGSVLHPVSGFCNAGFSLQAGSALDLARFVGGNP